jgi:cytochrome c553
MSRVLRVPEQVHNEATQIAALRRSQPGHLIAEAWNEYVANHRKEFAEELEHTAKLLRDGTLDELAAYVSREAGDRAEQAVRRLNARRS